MDIMETYSYIERKLYEAGVKKSRIELQGGRTYTQDEADAIVAQILRRFRKLTGIK